MASYSRGAAVEARGRMLHAHVSDSLPFRCTEFDISIPILVGKPAFFFAVNVLGFQPPAGPTYSTYVLVKKM